MNCDNAAKQSALRRFALGRWIETETESEVRYWRVQARAHLAIAKRPNLEAAIRVIANRDTKTFDALEVLSGFLK